MNVPFQYLVDGLIRVADPYSPLVLFAEDEGYPNGKTSDPVTLTDATFFRDCNDAIDSTPRSLCRARRFPR